jgi:hypothetical protein
MIFKCGRLKQGGLEKGVVAKHDGFGQAGLGRDEERLRARRDAMACFRMKRFPFSLNYALEHVQKKLLHFFDFDMLRLFDFAGVLVD